MNTKSAAAGTSGNDEITAFPGDIVDGRAGDDVITGTLGATMRGGAGTDALIFSAKGYMGSILLNVAKQFVQDVTVLPKTVVSSFERFDFRFGEGADILDLRGAKFDSNATWLDNFDGGNGNDTVYIDHTAEGLVSVEGIEVLRANLSQLSTPLTWDGTTIQSNGFTGIVRHSKSALIQAGNGNDKFTNTDLSGVVKIYAGGGNDEIGWTSSGNGRLFKGDLYDGGTGHDVIYGHLGATMRGGKGIDDLRLLLGDVSKSIHFRIASQLSSETTLTAGTKVSGFEHFYVQFGRGNDTLDASGMNFASTIYQGPRRISISSDFDGGTGTDTVIIDSHVTGNFALWSFEKLRANFSEVRSNISVENGATIRFPDFIFDGGIMSSVDIVGGYGNDTLGGVHGDDILSGGAGDDYLQGMNGDDILKGGAGRDTIEGGEGNDTYFIDKYDQVDEIANKGVDTAKIHSSYVLPAYIENLVLLGRKAIDGTGNASKNSIQGNNASNIVDGMAGTDIMDGLGGDDTYHVDRPSDIVIEAKSNGVDRILTSASYTLAAHVEVENLGTISASAKKAISLIGNVFDQTMTGNAGANTLSGLGGNDILSGGQGADNLYGGKGKDVFVFNELTDSAVKVSGRDTIYDFSKKQGDKIDLTGIDALTAKAGNQAFTFIGTEKFSKTAGELRYVKEKADTYVYCDVNGDGKADFALHIDSLVNLKAGDFLL